MGVLPRKSERVVGSLLTEHDIQNRIRLALSKTGIPFRTNAGTFYQGERHGNTLVNIRPVAGLPEGFTDLIYFQQGGKTAFIEVKAPGKKARKEQENFIRVMREMGFTAGVVHSVEEAQELIGGLNE